MLHLARMLCPWRPRARAGLPFNGVQRIWQFQNLPESGCWTTSSLAVLREFIDWSPFFHTWGLKGIYPRIFDHPEHGAQARQIFAEGNVYWIASSART